MKIPDWSISQKIPDWSICGKKYLTEVFLNYTCTALTALSPGSPVHSDTLKHCSFIVYLSKQPIGFSNWQIVMIITIVTIAIITVTIVTITIVTIMSSSSSLSNTSPAGSPWTLTPPAKPPATCFRKDQKKDEKVGEMSTSSHGARSFSRPSLGKSQSASWNNQHLNTIKFILNDILKLLVF